MCAFAANIRLQSTAGVTTATDHIKYIKTGATTSRDLFEMRFVLLTKTMRKNVCLINVFDCHKMCEQAATVLVDAENKTQLCNLSL